MGLSRSDVRIYKKKDKLIILLLTSIGKTGKLEKVLEAQCC